MRGLRPIQLLSLCAALALSAQSAMALAGGESVASALYSFDTTVRNYNLLTLSTTVTTTLNNYGDTQGGMAIRGALAVGNGGAVAAQLGSIGASGDPSLYVGGTLTVTGNVMLNGGYASVNSSANSANYTWNSGSLSLVSNANSGNDLNITNSGSSTNPLTGAAPSNWNWATVQSNLTTASTALANATANGTTVINGTISVNSQNLVLTPNSTPAVDSTVIFTLDASQLSGNSLNGQTFSNIQIDVPADVNYVVNVINLGSGTTTLFSGANFNSGSNDTNLLWNLEGSGTVALGTGNSFYGSILAPSATITNDGNTTINGQVAANAFTDDNTELHYLGFDAVSVVVPEPVTFALWGVALCGAGILVRRQLVRSGRGRSAVPVTR